MFGSHLSLSQLKLGHKRTGSYEIAGKSDILDENNNNNNTLTGRQASPAGSDFCRNNQKRSKKLRSISFSRLVYLKSNSYDLITKTATTTTTTTTSTPHATTNGELRISHEPTNNNARGADSGPSPIEQDGVTLCTLGVGTTFGASVMPGKSHSVSVVTNEECTLLRVRRADFQEIFNEQSHLIHDPETSPFFPFSSMGKSFASQSSDSGALTRIRPSSAFPSTSASRHSGNRQMSVSGADGALRHPRRPSLASSSGNSNSNSNNNNNNDQQRPASVTAGGVSAHNNHLARLTEGRRASVVAASDANEYHRRQSMAAASQSATFDDDEPPRIACNARQQQVHRPSSDARESCEQRQQGREESSPGAAAAAPTTVTDEEQEDVQQQQLEEDLNLDSLDASELTSQLMRVGWVLRTLILAEAPQMIKNRRVYPQLHHSLVNAASAAGSHQSLNTKLAARQAHHNRTPSKTARGKHLVSAGSSSQLFFSSSNASSGSSGSSSTTKSVASSAGRKVANYVASSFMRTTGGKQQTQAPPSSSTSGARQQEAGSGAGRYVSLSNSSPQQQRQFSSFDLQQCANGEADVTGGVGIGGDQSKPANQNHHQQQQQQSVADFACQEPVQLSRCLVGREMVDWLQQLSQTNTNAGRFVSSRLQAVSMWQVLLEQEIILSLPIPSPSRRRSSQSGLANATTANKATPMRDPAQFWDDQQAYYKFWFDCEPPNANSERRGSSTASPPVQALPKPPSESDTSLANEALWWSLKLLSKLAPDACLRLILSRQPHERNREEVDIVFEELQHLKALSHLTNSVKKQLAACVRGEHHARQNTVIFNQGDAGHSWYIILRGSVNVVIVGKGVVCTLHDGDDFGKLALVNDAPRAATIVTNEPNCYFLRVDKQDFNTILRDVEANTVRLKEHGKEVLILQKVAIKEQPDAAGHPHQHSAGQGESTAASLGAVAGGSSAVNNHSQAGLLGMAAGGGGGAAATSGSDVGLVQSVASGASGGAVGYQQSSATANQLSGQSSVALVAPTSATATTLAASQVTSCALKYMVMAGTGEKMLEHLLETRIDGQTQTAPLPLTKEALFQHDRVANYIQCHGDNFLEDFILTHKIFMPTGNLCQELLKQYQSSQAAKAAQNSTAAGANQRQRQISANSLVDDEYLVAKKRRVIKFVRFWMLINREHFFQQQQIYTFVMTLHQKVKMDAQRFPSLRPELEAITRIYELQLEESLESRHRGCQRWIEDVYGNILPIRRHLGPWQAPAAAAATATGRANGGLNSLQASAEQQQQQQQMTASEQFLASLHQRRFHHKLNTIQAEDELVFRVYCADHSYTTLKCRFDEQAGQIKQVAARNLKLDDKELILVHVKSNGERIIYNDQETNICTCLSVNGRLFVCPLEHIDAVSPLPEQDPFQEVYQSLSCVRQPLDENVSPAGTTGAANQQQQQQQQTNPLGSSNSVANQQDASQQQQQPISSHLLSVTPTNHADIKLQMSLSVGKLEEFSSRDIAYCLTQLAWSLLKNMHEFELVYTVFGRHNFKQITANLNVFLRHFNELQFWVVTQICLSTSLSKRVQILRKFIKIAAHCKELQNLNAFFAITMGLSNMAVARLTQTWERVPNKLKRTFSQFESQIDPSRNHRHYRLFLSTLEPPIIPFMPLFLKDMTFAHEGNKTYLESGLINFEKMQMIAQTLRTIRYCKSRAMKLDPSLCKFKSSIRSIDLFFRDLKIIDNQRTLTQMSHQLEHRKT